MQTQHDIGELLNRAIALHQQGKVEEAEALYRSILAAAPHEPNSLNLLGTILAQRGEWQEGIRLMDSALAAKPDYPDAWNNRGVALLSLESYAEALASFDKAIAQDPHYPNPHLNRAEALQQLKRYEEALASSRQAAGLNPDYAEAYNNQGNALQKLGREEEALECFAKAIALKPSYVEAITNRGIVLEQLARYDEANAQYEQAPDFPDAQWNRGLLALKHGDYAQGWPLYEWRWKRKEHEADLREGQLWLGDTPLAGKTILLHAEQGFGDTIQFSRYVPMVAALGAKVLLEAPAPLISLLSTLAGSPTLIERGKPLPAYDFHCPLMSLPLAFKTGLDSIPAAIPYLSAGPQSLGAKTGLRVGLVWAGTPKHRHDAGRSLSLAQLAPLWESGAEFHSLQKEVRPEDEATLKASPITTHDLHAFSDTAALLAEMDIVITVDTAVAHLAGALGKPFWLLLPHVADWRWLLGRDDSPWYPTARLFRQPKIGDWASVIGKVEKALSGLN